MKNKHIYITEIQQTKDCLGTIIRFKDQDEKEYHTYLENTETAQLAKEINEILMCNLYQIDEWVNKSNKEE